MAIVAALLLVSIWLWHSYVNDPMGDLKKGVVTEVNEPAVKELLDNAVKAIDRNDMRGVRRMMLNTDPMNFDETYAKVMFKERDFTPGEFKAMRKVERKDQTIYQADFFSTKRNRRYLFTVVEKKGKFRISEIEDNGK